MNEIEERLREAEREKRRKLEEEYAEQQRELTRFRSQMTSIAEELVVEERKRITAELYDQTELSQREIGEVIGQSHSWVSQTVREQEV